MRRHEINRWRDRRRWRFRTLRVTGELRAAPSAVSEELTKKHAKELRAQEKRLVAKHREEHEEAVEAATAKARESAPASTSVSTAEDQRETIDAAVTAALAAKDAELRTEHQTDIEKAVENSRLEGTMKLRLNNTQLIRAQSKVKELELQIEEWKKVGVVPGELAAPSASAPPAASLSLCLAILSCQNALALLSARPFI